MELIALGFLSVAVLAVVYFLYSQSQKQTKILLKQTDALVSQLKEGQEMLMAGSYQEWKRMKEGKKAPPNQVKDEPNLKDLDESEPIPFDEITGVQVESTPRQKVKIYQ